MIQTPVYMDNHATTPVDPRVLEAMWPYFSQRYGNPGSASHVFGWEAEEAVNQARQSIAAAIGAEPREIVFTSGATESNNLAIGGVAQRRERRPGRIVSCPTEHKSVLAPIARLAKRGFQIVWLLMEQDGHPAAGRIKLDQAAEAIGDDTILVSLMLANNEIGVIQPVAEIARLCQAGGALLHVDAAQALGKMPLDVRALRADLMSFSAHKIYGPKGVGALYVRGDSPAAALAPQLVGGAQERGRRAGTLNTPGIVGLAKAIELCLAELPQEAQRLAAIRNRLYAGLLDELPDVRLHGPKLDDPALRLPGNLNCSFPAVDGQALMMAMPELAVSSGSACASGEPRPSHVLRALGVSDELARSSLRFGLGRFNTADEADFAASLVVRAVRRLRGLAPSAHSHGR